MAMVAAQVMSNHIALSVCVSKGFFKLNVLRLLIIKNILNSVRILRDVCHGIVYILFV
jgi:fumarate hydratase class II